MNKPLCFVLMPFGTKKDAGGKEINFDAVYADLIKPAIENAGLQPVRADEELAGGMIHKPMYERLIICEYAVADLTTANANVYYELGVRHAVRPHSTVLLFAENTRLPFDVGPLRGMPYSVDSSGKASNCSIDTEKLTRLLNEARQRRTDSPIFQLIDGMVLQDLDHAKTDVFREKVNYSATVKERLAEARKKDVNAIDAVKAALGPIRDVEFGVLIDLLLSYRAVEEGWKEMVALVEEMPIPLANTVMVQEQYALALNRNKQGEKAERVLLNLIQKRGPSSETYGILGRVYKDRWNEAYDAGEKLKAQGLLAKAIDAYLKGFQTDWRDAYPGINAITLMEIQNPSDPRLEELFPVVKYSVMRRIESGKPDYWDYATLLEWAILKNDQDTASSALSNALANIPEGWKPDTTLNNIRLIRKARESRGKDSVWMIEIEDELHKSIQ
ncbi:MAG: DUF4071 domain-containing protein [Planctomycetes bacterium]|nr:DUF4071 domain-containing protein [Planctomycetota bacterium]